MSYNYPPEKLSVYLSDDGGSEFTFYALLEASHFSKHWIPFCKKFNVEPRSPSVYFAENSNDPQDSKFVQEWLATKKLYEDMKGRIESAIEKGRISKEIRNQHKGFLEWNSQVTKQNHQSIVQILIDGRNQNEVDVDGRQLPTLVYMSREKRPNWPHNFKAGSLNAMIRVSSQISNAPIILILDCDMYSNDSDAIHGALCFFMDEERGRRISYVQHPQSFNNVTNDDIYSNAASAISKIELAGIDGFDGALFCGTGCFHRRESLCGQKYSENYRGELNSLRNELENNTVHELEEASKVLADCSHEKGTQWGKEMGLVYGCPVEDIVTGLAIQCRGWKPVYYCPERHAFLGVAPTTLDQSLVQYKRWSEGMFQIFVSKYCPFTYGHGKIKLGAQMGYCVYLLWATISFPTLYYVVVPPLCLLRGIPLFPEVSSLWFLPFFYVYVGRNAGSIAEALACGESLKKWWNSQRMWLIRRTTSYAFALVDTIIRQLGFSQTAFVVTAKVADDDVLKRYEQGMLEFGSSSVMYVVASTAALLNLFSLVGGIVRVTMVWGVEDQFGVVKSLVPQIVLCWLVVLVNLPVYQALFLRSDNGRIPSSVMFKSVLLASLMVSLMPIY